MSAAAVDRGEALRREQEFHDALAAPLDAALLPPQPKDVLDTAILARAGSVTGLHVVELGCGIGDLTLHLLAQGPASLTALDLSGGMVEVARQRAQRFSPEAPADFVVAPVEATGLPDHSADLVVGKWILHHADIEAGAREIHRLLRPGGRAVFAENSGLNRVLLGARNQVAGRFGVPRYGTEDEHPLVASDYNLYRRLFPSVGLEFPDFCFLALADRQLLRFRYKLVTRMLSELDAAIWRWAPPLRRYSYHVVLELTA